MARDVMAKQKPKKKSAGPAWAHSAFAAKPRAQRRPSTPFEHACADLAAAMECLMRASVRDCYGQGAELALDLGPRAPRLEARPNSPGHSSEPVLNAFGSALPVEDPGRIVVRCVGDDDERFWAVTVALGPHAATLARTWWKLLDREQHPVLPHFPDTIYLTATVVAPHEAPPALRREQPYCALRHEGRDHFILTTRLDSERQGHRMTLTELEVLASIIELLARAGEDGAFDALPDDHPSGQMTRLAFVDGDGVDARVEWGTVERPEAPYEDDEDDEADDDWDDDSDSRWDLVDADTVERLVEQAARLELAEHWSECAEPRRVTVVWMESSMEGLLDDEGLVDDVNALREGYLSFLDTTTLEQLSLEPIAERTFPGAVHQILGFFEHRQGGRLPHELLVEDYDLLEAFSQLLGFEREQADLPIVEVALTAAHDAATRFARAQVSRVLCLAKEVREGDRPDRTPGEAAEALELIDFLRLCAAAAYLEFHSEHVRGVRAMDFGAFVFDEASEESLWRQDTLYLEDPHLRYGELARHVLAAIDAHGDGWLPEALEDGVILESVVEPLQALLASAPDLYLVRAVEDGCAKLVSLSLDAEASMRVLTLVPEPEPGEVLPLRRWRYGASELWLPAGKPMSFADAEDLLERVRNLFGGVDAAALRAATETILRESFAVASPDPDDLEG